MSSCCLSSPRFPKRNNLRPETLPTLLKNCFGLTQDLEGILFIILWGWSEGIADVIKPFLFPCRLGGSQCTAPLKWNLTQDTILSLFDSFLARFHLLTPALSVFFFPCRWILLRRQRWKRNLERVILKIIDVGKATLNMGVKSLLNLTSLC